MKRSQWDGYDGLKSNGDFELSPGGFVEDNGKRVVIPLLAWVIE